MNTISRASLVAFALVSAVAIAREGGKIEPIWNFHTGQTFLELADKNPQLPGIDSIYVEGLSDAYNFRASYDPRYRWVVSCTQNRQPAQLAAIFRKWLQANPEQWHLPAASLFEKALLSACSTSEPASLRNTQP